MEAIPRKYGEWGQFDRYCKLVLYHEAIDYLREMKCRRDREVSLDALSPADWDKLSTVDRYSCDSFTFSSHGYDLHIDNELVAEAFTADIAYTVGNDAVLDMNYVALHEGKKSVSEIKTDGVLHENSKKLFRGTIDFKKGAAGAVGNEKEDVLLLDDDVVNQTIPLILCAEEDVEGNHGATIGKLDDDMVFYLESRGMELPKIYKMMAKARIDAVLRLVPDEKTKADVASYLESEATNGRI